MKLQAKLRDILGSKVKNLRKEGLLPAVLYGKGVENKNLVLNYKDFLRIYREAGESTVLELVVDGGDTVNILITDVAFDPISGDAIHVDFKQVNMSEKVTANIPLLFEGESNAVKTDGGVLVKNITELEVSALPGDLPHEIKVDLSLLATFDDVIKISDLKVGNSVKVSAGEDDIIASVTPPRSQEELDSLSDDVAPVNVENIKSEADEKKEEKESKE